MWARFLILGPLLALPLGAGCSSADSFPLRAGAAAVVVTPVVEPFEDLNSNGVWDPEETFTDLNGDEIWNPVWIAGFGSGRAATGVHDELYARALVVEADGLRLGILSVDWVGLLYDHASEVRQRAREAGLGLTQLVVTSTHNHEGPDTMGLWGPALQSGRDEVYIEWAMQRMLEALARAVDSLEPVRIRAGVGQTSGLTRDSRKPEVIDEAVCALRFDHADGTGPVAIVAHWSNHAEVLDDDNQLITADYPAYLVAALEEAHPGATGIFWQGIIGGLLNPLRVEVRDEEGQVLADASFEKAERLGRLVATEALDALEQGQDITADGRLAFRVRSFLVPVDNLNLELALMAGLIERRIYDQRGSVRAVSEVGTFEEYLLTEVTVVDLGLAQIVTGPGELYPELALTGPGGAGLYEDPQDPGADFQGVPCEPPIYSSMRETPYRMVLGLANDEIGYIVPICQFDRVPPFTYGQDSAPYGESLSVGPQMAPILTRVLAEELQALNAGSEKEP